jgi:DNA (cytosine-5)-methyltransferase 1
MIKVGSDFSGVGAFNQALMRLGIDYKELFACDMDKYARQSFVANYGEPEYYPENVYDREIPAESLDIYMTSPPCQAFSLAGKRKGEDDKRGVLFYNSHEFIQKNKPRYFIFENVKGLLSDDKGRTFQKWVDWLGGKSVNGLPVLFPNENSVPYHIYHTVLNTKNFGVPQNRERVFIIGIRDDEDNSFTWPKEMLLEKRLKDVLEDEVDEKYFLSEKMVKGLTESSDRHKDKGTGFQWKPKTGEDVAFALRANGALCKTDNAIRVKSATSKGYEEATDGDSINYSVPNSKTRRGRVSKGVAQTLDTQCNQAVWIADYRADEGLRIRKDNISPCMTSSMRDSKEWNPKAGTRNPPLIGNDYKIRRLTPRECFRLQDFPDTFKFVCSDTQLYKQAGNSITVAVLAAIINKLKL